MSSLFGRLIGAGQVEDAIVGVLRVWMRTYLNEVERQIGETPGEIASPRSYRISGDVEKMPEDQTPCVIVTSPGTRDLPLVNGARQYEAQFQIETSVVVSARGGMETGGSPRALRLARMYALAMRACIVQQADDDSILFRRDWLGEDYDVLDSIDDRTICVGRVTFSIEVPDVTTQDAGPVYPLGPPPEDSPEPESPEWPIAVEADVEVVKTPLDQLPGIAPVPTERNDGE